MFFKSCCITKGCIIYLKNNYTINKGGCIIHTLRQERTYIQEMCNNARKQFIKEPLSRHTEAFLSYRKLR